MLYFFPSCSGCNGQEGNVDKNTPEARLDGVCIHPLVP